MKSRRAGIRLASTAWAAHALSGRRAAYRRSGCAAPAVLKLESVLMMRLARVVATVAVIASTLSHSSVTAAETAVATRPFLWKTGSETATIYLLGSMHVARTNLYPLPELVEEAFEASDSVIFEVPMDARSQFEALKKMTVAAALPEDETLKDHLPAEVLKRLDDYLAESGMDVGTLHRLRPWFVAIAITLQEAQNAGFNPMFGIEAHFTRKLGARSQGGLETIDEQVGMLSGMTAEQQVAFLDKTLEDAGKAAEQIDAIAELWSRGDADALDALLRESMKGNEEFDEIYQAMIVDRNYRMADGIEKLLDTRLTHFVIVGAAHLVGPEGIVEILRKKHYTVEQE